MTTEQTTEPTDLYQLAKTTSWTQHDWEQARSWVGAERFERWLPLLTAIDGHPKTVAVALRSAMLEPDGVQVLADTSPRARRYAEALARAAVADQRVQALTELLAEHEWHRNQAESELHALQDRVELGEHQLILSTGDAPPEYVTGLIDLTDGRCWVRGKFHNGTWDPTYWIHANEDPRHQTQYEWPIGDAGPFIALPDGWHLTKLNEAAQAWDALQKRLREILRSLPGYDDPESGRSYVHPPALDAALSRVLMAKDTRFSEQRRETAAFDAKVRTVESNLRSLQRSIEVLANQAEDSGDGVPFEQLRALLPQDGAS